MAEQPYEHRLAAILYADVAGYSRLTGEDEVGTHQTLSAYLEMFSESIRSHGGNVAARPEGLAEPDGVCVSDAVRKSVGSARALRRRVEAWARAKRRHAAVFTVV